MARPYELSGGIQGLSVPGTAERIIESLGGKRSTKTFINSERSAILLALVEAHGRGVVRALQKLHLVHYKQALTEEQVLETYSGAKFWADVHQFLVEHYVSQEGFSIDAAVHMRGEADAKTTTESSIKPTEP